METANVIWLIFMLSISLTLLFQGISEQRELNNSFYNNDAIDFVGTAKIYLSIILALISLLSFFYGKLFTDAAYDLQIIREKNEQFFWQNQKMLILLEQLGKTVQHSNQNTESSKSTDDKEPEPEGVVTPKKQNTPSSKSRPLPMFDRTVDRTD